MIMEKDTLIRVKDNEGNEYILYPATKLENVIGAEEALNKKASLEYVNQELAIKADTEEMTEALSTKVNVSDNEIAMSQKADLQEGKVPIVQLPYYSTTPNVYIDDVLIGAVVFVDVTDSGDVYLRADGKGEYMVYMPLDGCPRAKYIGVGAMNENKEVSNE